jgi:DNA-binding beta-propeller fold protein YncE
MMGGETFSQEGNLNKSLALLMTLFVVFALETTAQEKLPLKLIATIPLPDLVGDLEFFAPDLKGNCLFLCAENSKMVEVFNLDTGKRIHTIKGFGEPHDIVALPNSNKLIVTDGGDDFGWVELIITASSLWASRLWASRLFMRSALVLGSSGTASENLENNYFSAS